MNTNRSPDIFDLTVEEMSQAFCRMLGVECTPDVLRHWESHEARAVLAALKPQLQHMGARALMNASALDLKGKEAPPNFPVGMATPETPNGTKETRSTDTTQTPHQLLTPKARAVGSLGAFAKPNPNARRSSSTGAKPGNAASPDCSAPSSASPQSE